MTTKEEIKEYVNTLIANQGLSGLCFISGSNVIIRVSGQYSRTNLEHLITQYPEIIDYIIETRAGFVDVFYIYVE